MKSIFTWPTNKKKSTFYDKIIHLTTYILIVQGPNLLIQDHKII